MAERAPGLPRGRALAATLEVEAGWERAVETALGDYLEAVCVEQLEALGAALGALDGGSVTLVRDRRADARRRAGDARRAASRGPGGGARAARAGAHRGFARRRRCAARASLAEGQSLITRAGEWVGRDWLRVSRGADPHAGVLEREQRLKGLRARGCGAAERVQRSASGTCGARARSWRRRKPQRDGAQAAHPAGASHARGPARRAARRRARAPRSRSARRRAIAAATPARWPASGTRPHAALHARARRAGARPQPRAPHWQRRAQRARERARRAARRARRSARARRRPRSSRARDLHVQVEVAPLHRELGRRRPGAHERAARAADAAPRRARAGAGLRGCADSRRRRRGWRRPWRGA